MNELLWMPANSRISRLLRTTSEVQNEIPALDICDRWSELVQIKWQFSALADQKIMNRLCGKSESEMWKMWKCARIGIFVSICIQKMYNQVQNEKWRCGKYWKLIGYQRTRLLNVMWIGTTHISTYSAACLGCGKLFVRKILEISTRCIQSTKSSSARVHTI